MSSNDRTIWLIYDGDCPICAPSANALMIKKAAGKLELVNAREAQHPMVREAMEKGFNLDKDTLVKVNQQYYYGADALHFLALIGTKSNWINRMNVFLFRHKIMAKVCYPFFVYLRNIMLKLKGRNKIHGV